jgi:hypothetical protein
MDPMLHGIVGTQAKIRSAAGQNLRRSPQQVADGVPVVRAYGIYIERQRLAVQRDTGVLMRLQQLGRLPENLPVKEGSAFRTDGHDSNVPGHGP